VLPYWPAGQTYDTPAGNNQLNPMWAFATVDKGILYEIQANGSISQSGVGQGANLGVASQGSVYTGFSSQYLNPTLVGATAATFIVDSLAPYDNNLWGDAFTIVRVRISNYQGQIA
jgi:hypothetical protein